MFIKCLPLYFLLILDYALSQDANCNFFQTVVVGVTYDLKSPNYPNSYGRGVQCRWVADCPVGYNCRLDCTEVNMPQTSSCSQDRLLVSRSGDLQLNNADYYCGQGQFSSVSSGTRLSIGLITALNSPGGRFRCSLYAQRQQTGGTCSCGYRKQNRIVGGVETGVNEFPMMVGLADPRINEIKCGGVIIDKRYVLTAAHCLEGFTPSGLAVIAGEHDVNSADSSATAGYLISQFIVHPLYTSSNYDYDIAILRLQSDIVFSDRVGPVCLPFKYTNNDMTGAQLTILGWGTLFPGGPKSNVLRKVNVDVISQNSCQSAVPTLTSRQICTYTPGKDACQDDSGGPLLYTDNSGLLFNIGIVSSGQFCATAGKPGVNTRVPVLLDWIVSNTPGANYCLK
ncbi:unnamed protein product [Diatraea saccharalis]|uniref:Venom serine protease 34 n=1 Tax=Diatraea saccharalis TaxID=40085 RepID=A0A9N9RAL2_9NEOP|nr:unnamed protein product [Diatraea saccharalis]